MDEQSQKDWPPAAAFDLVSGPHRGLGFIFRMNGSWQAPELPRLARVIVMGDKLHVEKFTFVIPSASRFQEPFVMRWLEREMARKVSELTNSPVTLEAMQDWEEAVALIAVEPQEDQGRDLVRELLNTVEIYDPVARVISSLLTEAPKTFRA